MDSQWDQLLAKTRAPQPSFQRLAVVSLFTAVRSSPRLSSAAADAVGRCLASPSAAVADQAVRELCRLVTAEKNPIISPSDALVELQSALEGCPSRFVPVFVKGVGFLVRFCFQNDEAWRRRGFDSVGLHPFVKVLSCRAEVREELIQQVLLFIVHCKSFGMRAVVNFLRPFVLFAIVSQNSSASSAAFLRDLFSSIVSLVCSFPSESFSILKLLTHSLCHFSCSNSEEFNYLCACAESLVDAFIVVLEHIAPTETLTCDIQVCGVDLIDYLLTVCTDETICQGRNEIVLKMTKHLLVTQKELGLHYLPDLVKVAVSLAMHLTIVEFEHDQLSVMKILLLLQDWKTEQESTNEQSTCCLSEELLCLFPVISLMSSPSKSIKAAAAKFLSSFDRLLLDVSIVPMKLPLPASPSLSASRLESIVFGTLQRLWFQKQSFFCFFPTLHTRNVSENVQGAEAKYWTDHLKEYLENSGSEKSGSSQQVSQVAIAGPSFLLSSLAFILVLHPELGASAIDCLATLGAMDPKLGTPMLLVVLFYTKIFCNKDCCSPEMSLKVLETLPSLAMQPAMAPLVLQTLLPMLQENVNPVLYAAAVRLLCKTWVITDWAFGTLQRVLDPKAFSRFSSVEEISESLAVSVRDVCRHDPDRGVDIILSVSSCTESSFSSVQALGLESVAYLCEADVVDFYTAWKAILDKMHDYSADPVIVHGLCTLLRWGAMDADAYPEDAKIIISILWQFATSTSYKAIVSWFEVRKAAFLSLSQFKVANVLEAIPEFKTRNLQTLVSENNEQLLGAIEEFEVGIIKFEHMTRRRMHMQKRNKVHKVEKLLDVFPQVIFSTGKFEVNQLPGAALLSSVFTPKDLVTQGTSKKDLAKLHAAYEGALVEIAESLELSRSLLVAILAVQSWKPFVQQWMMSAIVLAAKGSSTLDTTILAANDILKRLCKIVEGSPLPQVSVNAVLSIGAFCMVLPPTAHLVISAASDILLKLLFEPEHEHLQWSSAISLGLLSTSFDVTNEKQKFEVMAGLLKVLRSCKSYLTIGACGMGLGFASQNLLKRVKSDLDSNIGGTVWDREVTILHDIVSALSQKICHLCPSVCGSLTSLSKIFPIELNEAGTSEFLCENKCNLEEDAWGVAGLVMGLGSSSIPLYRLGAYDSVTVIRDLLISWMSATDSPGHGSTVSDDPAESSLCMGSCLVLPTVVTFCQRNELADNDFDMIFELYSSLISDLLDLKMSAKLYQNLLMASCVGVGLFFSLVANLGMHAIEYDIVKRLFDILRNAYTQSYPPLVCLGGMIGVVNAFGADAGYLLQAYPQSTLRAKDNKSSSSVSSAVLSNPYYETISTTMIQEILLFAKESKNHQLQSYAAWAASFLRHHLFSNEFLDFADLEGSSTDMKISSQSLSEDSLVFKLCLWLRDVEFNKTGDVASSSTIATILRCLSHAPRLPDFDWDSIIRRLMKYESQLCKSIGMEDAVLRIECVQFSLTHAKHVGSLLYILDELIDLPRFRRLELNLQSVILKHFSDLLNLFSTKRTEKMFDDLVEYFISSNSLYLVCEESQQRQLRISFWKGLSGCLLEEFVEDLVISSKMKRAMESLFSLLPVLLYYSKAEKLASSCEEWSVAMRFLSKAPESWLVDLLQIPVIGVLDTENLTTLAKKIIVKAKLVALGCFPAHVLGELKARILNAKTDGIWWAVLVEISAALTMKEGLLVGQWLLDALDTSCVTAYPSTALRLVGLLASSCCKYMPLLVNDPITVLSDLPVSLPSLLSDNRWHSIATPLVEKLYNAAERLCKLAVETTGESQSGSFRPAEDVIDASEMEMSNPLARILYQTCICLQNYLPFEKRLKLINLEILEI